MNATEIRYANLSKYTVKELGQILHQMGAKGWSGLRKADLVNLIMVQIDIDHSEAIRMNAEAEQETFTIPYSDVTITDPASVKYLKWHYKALQRYNPTLRRDSNGRVILTPKQRKRLRKNGLRLAKRVGLLKMGEVSA